MPAPSDTLTHESPRAQSAAQVVLCVLAGVSVVGTIWAIGHAPDTLPTVAPTSAATAGLPTRSTFTSSPTQPPYQQQQLFTPSASYNAPQSTYAPPPSYAPPSSPPSFTSQQPPVAQRQPPVEAAPPSLPPGRQLKNSMVIEFVQTARNVRKTGDNGAALEALRAADLREPSHPEILSEMALTYESMGLPAKALPFWRSVKAMGETNAGGYHALASKHLSGGNEPIASGLSATQTVILGDCHASLLPPAVEGMETISVKVPLLSSPGAVIDPSQIEIHVFLYENVNDGERIEQARTDPPRQEWVTQPLDWQQPEGETLELIYNLGAASPEERRDLGKRSFHGFIVKVFYQNKLVGEFVEPLNLKDTANSRSGPAGLDNSLFPR